MQGRVPRAAKSRKMGVVAVSWWQSPLQTDQAGHFSTKRDIVDTPGHASRAAGLTRPNKWSCLLHGSGRAERVAKDEIALHGQLALLLQRLKFTSSLAQKLLHLHGWRAL